MKLFKWLLFTCLLTMVVQVFGQTNTVALPADAPPQTVDQLVALVIPLITTGIVYLFGKISWLPRPALPVLALAIGPVIGYALTFVSNLKLTPGQMVIMGGMAVTLREITNQLVTKQIKPLEASKTDTKPVDNAVTVAAPPTTPTIPLQ